MIRTDEINVDFYQTEKKNDFIKSNICKLTKLCKAKT